MNESNKNLKPRTRQRHNHPIDCIAQMFGPKLLFLFGMRCVYISIFCIALHISFTGNKSIKFPLNEQGTGQQSIESNCLAEKGIDVVHLNAIVLLTDLIVFGEHNSVW